MAKHTKAQLEKELQELREKVTLLEDTVRRLLTQPQVPQYVPFPVPCPCPTPAAPDPYRVVPYHPYQPPLWPMAPQWPLSPDILCNAPVSETTTSCAIH